MCERFRLTLFCIKKISEVQTIPLIRERPRALTKPFEKKYRALLIIHNTETLSLQEKLPYIYMVHLKSIWKTYINI